MQMALALRRGALRAGLPPLQVPQGTAQQALLPPPRPHSPTATRAPSRTCPLQALARRGRNTTQPTLQGASTQLPPVAAAWKGLTARAAQRGLASLLKPLLLPSQPTMTGRALTPRWVCTRTSAPAPPRACTQRSLLCCRSTTGHAPLRRDPCPILSPQWSGCGCSDQQRGWGRRRASLAACGPGLSPQAQLAGPAKTQTATEIT